MNKTASEIADIVLEKVAISPTLARKVLMRKVNQNLKQLGTKHHMGMATDVVDAHPRAAARAYASRQPGMGGKVVDSKQHGMDLGSRLMSDVHHTNTLPVGQKIKRFFTNRGELMEQPRRAY